jgi:site-specific DNA-methyltransferase (adenine-specific)
MRSPNVIGAQAAFDDNSGKAKRVIVQVKSGHVKSGNIRSSEPLTAKAQISVFITLEKATSHMIDKAALRRILHLRAFRQGFLLRF